MILSHMISDAVLAGVGFWAFVSSFQRVPFYSRLLWGFFFVTIALAALAGVFTFGGLTNAEPLHQSLTLLAGSLGVVCVVVAVYTAVLKRPATQLSFSTTTLIGLILFIALLVLPAFSAFAPVIPSLGLLMVMVLAVFGLRQRQPWVVWVIVAVMLMALATKAGQLPLPLHPTDTYHYLIALALLCFGKAGKKL